jgi:chromosome segregation ATPase
MKKQLYLATVAAIAAGSIFSACESKEKKVENAEQKVNNDQQNLQAAKDSLNAEYPGFKADAENRIADNDKKIARLQDELSRPGDHPLDNARRRKIQDLSRRNADLRSRLATYQTAQTDWITFKSRFNADMDTLNQAYAALDKANGK